MTVLIRDLWDPVWPNLVASALWAPAALWWHQSRIRKHVTAEMRQLHADVSDHPPDTEERP